MRLYDGKTLTEWREWLAETGEEPPPRVKRALANSERWQATDMHLDTAQRLRQSQAAKESAGGDQEEDGFPLAAGTSFARQQAALQQQIEQEGTAFLRRYGTVDELGNTVITDQVLTELTVVAIKTLYHHAVRGDLRAAEIIINKCVPEPRQTLDVRVQSMSREDVEAERVRILAGLAPGVRAALEARLARGTVDGDGEDE
jgi:hypothetical protein